IVTNGAPVGPPERPCEVSGMHARRSCKLGEAQVGARLIVQHRGGAPQPCRWTMPFPGHVLPEHRADHRQEQSLHDETLAAGPELLVQARRQPWDQAARERQVVDRELDTDTRHAVQPSAAKLDVEQPRGSRLEALRVVGIGRVEERTTTPEDFAATLEVLDHPAFQQQAEERVRVRVQRHDEALAVRSLGQEHVVQSDGLSGAAEERAVLEPYAHSRTMCRGRRERHRFVIPVNPHHPASRPFNPCSARSRQAAPFCTPFIGTAQTGVPMRGLLYDIRQAVRGLRARPGFTISVLLTLAVGIGAGTAMFSVLDTVLLAPLPQRNADRVVRLYQPTPQSETTGLSPLEIRDFREQSSALEDVVEYHSMPFTFVGARDAERLQTGVVSASFFQALGVTPVMGRLFRPGEDQPGADPVVRLSWTYGQRAHGGDPGVIGTGLRMNDRIHTIIGVLPPLPQYPDENDVYMPTSSCPFRAGPGWAENRQARGTALALVRVGTSHDALMTELRTISARLQAQYPEAYDADRSFGIAAVPLPELIARPARTTVLLLSGATGLLLLIMCSNVGNLLIVRLLRRDAEIAVRTAFGASRSRIKRLLATEAVVLALAGGAIGLLLARASTDLLAAFAARFTPRAAEIGVDGRVIA